LRLKKALYGTKQAANAWQNFLAEILISLGGKRHPKDESVYIFQEGNKFLFLGTHVDDLFPLYNQGGKQLKEKILTTLKTKMQIDEKGEIKFALDTHTDRQGKGGVENFSNEIYRKSFKRI